MAAAFIVPNTNPRLLTRQPKSPGPRGNFAGLHLPSNRRTFSPAATASSSFSLSRQSLRCAVLGAGFAGLSVAWHLLQHSPKEMHLKIDIFDEAAIGGGASGVSGGLLHPYSPKVKLLWRGSECWNECLKLVSVAEAAISSDESSWETRVSVQKSEGFIVRKRGILRPAINLKNLNVLIDNSQKCLASCRIESIEKDAAQKLVPNLCVPLNRAFYMPEALTILPQRYLKGLFLACENVAKEMSTLYLRGKELSLHKKSIVKLLELSGEYDAVVICLGARIDMLPELHGKLPLRTCRGVIAHLELPDHTGEDYPDCSPSILSDAWLAFPGPRSLHLGSTWEWNSRNYSPIVSVEEASKALQELLPKASAIFPCINSWNSTGARAGLRAMPPLTPKGSLPLLGCVDDLVGGNRDCKFWLFGGLGARGLLYHAWLGKLMAQAVLSCNEKLIPSELISWRKISNNKEKYHNVLV